METSILLYWIINYVDNCQGLTWTVTIHDASAVLEETKLEQAYQQIQFYTDSEWHVMGEVAMWVLLFFIFKFENNAVVTIVSLATRVFRKAELNAVVS
jgi:uncharacterized DUF497 family protein